MSLLNRVANREVHDFLRTLTIKSTYFADKIRSTQILSTVEERVPETANPYVMHLAGHYVLNDIGLDEDGNEENQKGLWTTKDTTRNKFKNYWRRVNDVFERVSSSEMEYITNPKKAGLWEIQPFIVHDVVDPITGLKEDQYYYRSQMIYDREGYLSDEVRNTELFTEDSFDEMMYVTSLDTQQTIPFTLENFYIDEANEAVAQGRRKNNSIHTKTLEAYRIPGRYFDLLCKRYPKQVDLIKAIVYRVPGYEISSLITIPELEKQLLNNKYATAEYIASLETRFPNKRDLLKKLGSDLEGARDKNGMSLAEYRRTRIAKAENFALLNYDYSTLDDTEQISLLEHVKKVLEIIRRRWAVNEYNFEENYAAVLWTVLWSVLPTSLIAKRYANIKTPHVSSHHMWDYLSSKGLADYRGYLTNKQTWFLYKNINYLLQHRAQQKTLNILIDNILNDYGLTIKSNTVVLDTTDSLSYSATPTDPAVQCETCSRHGVSCFKHLQEHLCDEWLGTKTLCKAEPIVLDEEFAGASKEKVIRQLIKQYGYSEEAAETKYKRSFIWRDEDVEAIKDDLNRDQMVDMDVPVHTLDDTIYTEHVSGLEPVYSDMVVDEQRKDLQHMHGTYAPTKLLKLIQKQYNVKFADLFNRFITDTFLRLAPRKNSDGTVTKKVNCSYKFHTTEGAADYLFDFGEALAACYVGFVREYVVDALVDVIKTTESGEIEWTQKRFTDLMNKVDYNFPIPDRCLTTTALRFGRPVMQEKLVRQWTLFDGTGQEDLEAYTESQDTKAKEGKKYYVKNDDETYTEVSIEAGTDISDKGYYQELVPNRDANTRILTIQYGSTDNEVVRYAVTRLDEPETFCKTPDETALEYKTYYTLEEGVYTKADVNPGDALESGKYYEEDSIWTEFTIRLKVLGQFLTESISGIQRSRYYENDDEIPIIPQYFRWYYNHLNPATDLSEEEKEPLGEDIMLAQKPIWNSGVVTDYVPVEANYKEDDDTDKAFQDQYPDDPCHQDGKLYIDTSTRKVYRLFRMSQYLDVESLISRWVDITGVISDKAVIANYIDVMFEILEEIYSFACASGSVRTHHACRTFLEQVIKKDVIRFDLTGTECKHDNTEGGLSAYYSDWFKNNKELLAAFNIIDRLDDPSVGWNEFNTGVVQKLLEGCTIAYASEIVTDAQYKKLKQLVRSLSSYRINFVDDAETGHVCNGTAPIVEDALVDEIRLLDTIYFDPIGDSIIPPRVGGYTVTDDNNCIVVPTSDLRRVKDKTYYTLTYADSDVYNHPDERQQWHPVARPLGREAGSTSEGAEIEVGAEAINLPATDEFQPYRQTTDKYVLTDKTYYKYRTDNQRYVAVDVTYFTSVKTSEVTEELPTDVLKGKDASGNEVVYRIDIAFEEIAVGDRLPYGRCFEKINLYTILGIKEGTPLLISKVNNRWYYCTGQTRTSSYRVTGDLDRHMTKEYFIYAGYGVYRPTMDDDFAEDGTFLPDVTYYELSVTPASQADVEDEDFNEEMYKEGDRFDLQNNFSTATNKAIFDSTIYRLNLPITAVDWDEPVQSLVLEHWLYPTVNHEFYLTESTEPSLLILESSYPETTEET